MMLIEVEELAGEQVGRDEHLYSQWARRCEGAAELLEDHPDEAALLLDGLLGHIAHEWEQKLGLANESVGDMLAQIEHVAPEVGWRLRLALRAPDVRARLAACQALIAAVFREHHEYLIP